MQKARIGSLSIRDASPQTIRKTNDFERDTLYAEVWADPVTSVARRYEISDVGLRKIFNNWRSHYH
jgi:hypothetical protein